MSFFRPLRHGRLACLLALALLLWACSAPTRLKVLGFFFDGVPGASPVRTGVQSPVPRLANLPPPAADRPKAVVLPIVSTHKPVSERQCGKCHTAPSGRYEPIEMNEQLCDRCHKELREREGWNHGPINTGMCLPCHRAHESPYPHLLDQPMPDVCLICHKEDLARPGKHHQVPNVNDCTACHNPHRLDKNRS